MSPVDQHQVTPPSPRWFLAFLLAVLVAHEFHELAHTGVGRLACGAWGARDFNVWSLAAGCESLLATFAGPAFSWTLIWTGVWLVRDGSPGRRWTGLALIFAPNPLGRLLPALVGGGDEGVLARALVGGPGPLARLVVALAAAVILLPALWAAWRALPERRRAGWFLLLFSSGILITGPLFVVGNGLLARGVLSSPGLLGAPVLVEVVTALSMLGLALTWRDLRNGER
jgi:hypothetical protein